MRTSGIVLLLLLSPSPGVTLTIVNSKHDLGFNSTTTGPKATAAGNTEKCVFCHTPHRPGRNVPLWNHTLTTQTFTFYGSNYLQNYLAITKPADAALTAGNRSRLCLSCHDGVTAVGGVYNLGGAATTINLSGGVGAGAFPGTSAANLDPVSGGTVNLADDHPVRYPVRPGAGVYTRGLNQDPEIVLPPNNDPVKLYDPATGNPKSTPAAGDLVECTSCHDPHDSVNGYFLVKSNASAAICTTCHVKLGWAGAAVHATSAKGLTATWYSGPASATVGAFACRSCHRMHGASVANGQAYLLRGPEEDTCLACHRAGGVATRDLNSLVNDPAGHPYRHPTVPVSGRHVDPETNNYMPESKTNLTNNRHAECQDCHDPHMAQSGNRIAKATPNNLITPVLLGSWGVRVTAAWPAAPGVAGSNNLVPMPAASYSFEQLTNTASHMEYQLCFKCHSSWNLGVGAPPYAGAASYTTEQSREFNPNNASFHPVVSANNNIWCNSETMVAPWNGGGHYTMFCSDCHGSANAADAEGPHGSSQDTGGAHGLLQQSLVAVPTGSKNNYATPLCVRCHAPLIYVEANAKGNSGFPEHPGDQGAHSVGPNTTGAGPYGGCLVCHGNLTPATPTYGSFHGSNWYWTAAHPGSNFVTNTTNLADWWVTTVGTVNTASLTKGQASNAGNCTPTAAGCASHGSKSY
ncbi:MAG: cytochrome c3 family protein [Candidatus Coatesbacteria bacterium]